MNTFKVLLLVCLGVALASSDTVSIEKGWLTLDVSTGDSKEQHKVQYNGLLKETLALTQSSKINIMARLTFSVQGFMPEFFSFRLRHSHYDNLTEPVLASWDDQHRLFSALVDLGDPKQIKHLSGDYKLQLIISDDRFQGQVRRNIANCKVNFRYSLDKPQGNELHYSAPSIIMTEAPAQRIDPPALFTGFVCVVLVVLFFLFLMGLNHQKANLNLFPSSGTGSILNIVFLGALGVVLFWLLKFWINWTFLQTVQYFFLGVLPFSLAANYAFIHIKKS